MRSSFAPETSLGEIQNGKNQVKPDLEEVSGGLGNLVFHSSNGKTDLSRKIYSQAAERKGLPIFALTVVDFFNAPTITGVNLSAYIGQAGSVVKVNALMTSAW